MLSCLNSLLADWNSASCRGPIPKPKLGKHILEKAAISSSRKSLPPIFER